MRMMGSVLRVCVHVCLAGEAVISLASHILLSPSVIIFSHLSPCQRAREPWDEVAFGLESTISSSCKKKTSIQLLWNLSSSHLYHLHTYLWERLHSFILLEWLLWSTSLLGWNYSSCNILSRLRHVVDDSTRSRCDMRRNTKKNTATREKWTVFLRLARALSLVVLAVLWQVYNILFKYEKQQKQRVEWRAER